MKAAQVELVVVAKRFNEFRHGSPLIASGSPASSRRELLPLEPAGLIVSRLKFRRDLVADLVGLRLVGVDLFDRDCEDKLSDWFLLRHWDSPLKRKTGAPT